MFKWLFERVRVLYLCRKYGIENYTINKDNSINVQGDLYLRGYSFKKLPIKFNSISGNFDCSNNQLTSFENFPKEVGRSLYVNNNKIESLTGLPMVSIFRRGIIDISHNNIKSFEGITSICGSIHIEHNPISKIWSYILSGRRDKNKPRSFIPDQELNELIELINEYDFIRGDEIILDRFNEFLSDVCRKGHKLHKHQFRIFKKYKIVQ